VCPTRGLTARAVLQDAGWQGWVEASVGMRCNGHINKCAARRTYQCPVSHRAQGGGALHARGLPYLPLQSLQAEQGGAADEGRRTTHCGQAKHLGRGGDVLPLRQVHIGSDAEDHAAPAQRNHIPRTVR
jgi:hypothetical protein